MRPSVEPERREQLIAAAARVIARSGYDAATVRDVAREAGVSTGVIAYYFEGKDDLFAHVLRSASRAFRARLESARDGAETPRDRLLALAEAATPADDDAVRAHALWIDFWARAARDPALASLHPASTTAGAGRSPTPCARVSARARSGPTPIPRRSRAATPLRPTASRRTSCCTGAWSRPTTCVPPPRRSSTHSRARPQGERTERRKLPDVDPTLAPKEPAMRRSLLLPPLTLLVLLVAAAPAFAGGWATVGLDSTPAGMLGRKAVERQHHRAPAWNLPVEGITPS